ncbi:MAG: hypothetical protein WBD22_12410 [Pyrinomonadaceae bacterium]
MKIIGLAVLALLLGVGVYVWKTEFGDDEIFILPEGYIGFVLILHDQKNGEPGKYESGKRVYEIPSNGILKTQFSLNTGWHSPGKYFYKQNGKLTEIPYLFDDRDIEARRAISSKIHICCPSNGVAGKDPSGPSIV